MEREGWFYWMIEYQIIVFLNWIQVDFLLIVLLIGWYQGQWFYNFYFVQYVLFGEFWKFVFVFVVDELVVCIWNGQVDVILFSFVVLLD